MAAGRVLRFRYIEVLCMCRGFDKHVN